MLKETSVHEQWKIFILKMGEYQKGKYTSLTSIHLSFISIIFVWGVDFFQLFVFHLIFFSFFLLEGNVHDVHRWLDRGHRRGRLRAARENSPQSAAAGRN